MRPEVWALLGVAVGAVLTGAMQLVQALLHRRWARKDAVASHAREREARLFDHQRVAYTEFLDQLQKHKDATFLWVHDIVPGPGPDWDSYDAVQAATERVGIYGSAPAYATARAAMVTLISYGQEGTAEEEPKLEALTSTFRTQARKDLGVDPPDTRSA